jgi:transmembrane sensor
MEIMRDPDWEAAVSYMLEAEIEALEDQYPEDGLTDEQAHEVFSRVLATIHEAPVIPMGQRRSHRRIWWAAASVLLILGSATYVFLARMRTPQTSRIPVAARMPAVLPGGNKAVLTIGDGRRITLDSTAKGVIAMQGSVSALNCNGQLSYSGEGGKASVVYNTITVPRGGQYRLVLPDGTRVWLNAASSLTFPTAFTDRQRRVELTGEGYFEVTHRPATPFLVKAGKVEVRDIGTAFNVNAYMDETSLKTTLVEGAVGVNKTPLQPGQQAQLGSDGVIRVVAHADVAEATAWKNGYFDFEQADLPTIMRQLSRWYNLDIEYQGKMPPGDFRARMPRNTSASEVLRILEANGVHCAIEGKKLIVR